MEADEKAFYYVRSTERKAVLWCAVKEVFAFKRDLFARDLICIGFRVSDAGEYWEIDEEMAGWECVLAGLIGAFPGVDEQWWEKVVFTPFQTHVITLWGEPKILEIWGEAPVTDGE